MFDNIIKTMAVRTVFTGATLVSTEIDFELPRGFIAKIHDILIKVNKIMRDFEAIAAQKSATLNICLIRDPDDITTIQFPSNTVDHDVLAALEVEVDVEFGTAETDIVIVPPEARIEKNFSAEGLDAFTARNMRFNIDALGTDAADITESEAEVFIDYTLERITDDDIINLLDIL